VLPGFVTQLPPRGTAHFSLPHLDDYRHSAPPSKMTPVANEGPLSTSGLLDDLVRKVLAALGPDYENMLRDRTEGTAKLASEWCSFVEGIMQDNEDDFDRKKRDKITAKLLSIHHDAFKQEKGKGGHIYIHCRKGRATPTKAATRSSTPSSGKRKAAIALPSADSSDSGDAPEASIDGATPPATNRGMLGREEFYSDQLTLIGSKTLPKMTYEAKVDALAMLQLDLHGGNAALAYKRFFSALGLDGDPSEYYSTLEKKRHSGRNPNSLALFPHELFSVRKELYEKQCEREETKNTGRRSKRPKTEA
jgi:hypothetical protein